MICTVLDATGEGRKGVTACKEVATHPIFYFGKSNGVFEFFELILTIYTCHSVLMLLIMLP